MLQKAQGINKMKQFLDTFNIVTNLEPSGAFFGCGINGFKVYGWRKLLLSCKKENDKNSILLKRLQNVFGFREIF